MNISVHEEFDCREDLLPTKSPFAFRLAPTVDVLSWRYNMRLSFVRYRLFRILAGERSAGCVIINDGREGVLIAQCDADNPITLAHGVWLALLKVGAQEQRPRAVRLTSLIAEMSEIYCRSPHGSTGPWLWVARKGSVGYVAGHLEPARQSGLGRHRTPGPFSDQSLSTPQRS